MPVIPIALFPHQKRHASPSARPKAPRIAKAYLYKPNPTGKATETDIARIILFENNPAHLILKIPPLIFCSSSSFSAQSDQPRSYRTAWQAALLRPDTSALWACIQIPPAPCDHCTQILKRPFCCAYQPSK